MKRLLTFVGIGSFFATVEEFLTVVVLRHDVPTYLFTLFVLFPAFLALVYASAGVVDRLAGRAADLAHLLTFGSVGLLLEWTLMGLSPWSHPGANPLLMIGFQLGMFCFWATVATAPRLFLGPRGPVARRRVLRFYVPYFLVVYAVGLSVLERARFATIIPLIIVGYAASAALLAKHAADSLRHRAGPDDRGGAG